MLSKISEDFKIFKRNSKIPVFIEFRNCVEYTAESLKKNPYYLIKQLLTFNFSLLMPMRIWSMID